MSKTIAEKKNLYLVIRHDNGNLVSHRVIYYHVKGNPITKKEIKTIVNELEKIY